MENPHHCAIFANFNRDNLLRLTNIERKKLTEPVGNSFSPLVQLLEKFPTNIFSKFVVIGCLIQIAICCPDGYYGYNQGCIPCESSCKTCSNSTTCDTCESFMMIDPVTSFCAHCAADEYFDETLKICRNCMDTCLGECQFRQPCMACDLNESLDLDTLSCVTDCLPPQVKLGGHHMSLPSVCRALDYYIDPLSTSDIELGTKKHPYRTMKAASSEILTFLSHQPVSITLFVKDVYIEDKSIFFLNITHVAIKSHPDVLEKKQRALIIPTEFPQIGISKKARFHLLQSVQLPVLGIISLGTFTPAEQMKIGGQISNVVARSGIKFENVDFYREEIDYNKDIIFMLGVYLQNKTASFENMKINITGMFWTTQDPFNLYVRNIEFDTYSLRNVFAFLIDCNYPEANKMPFMDIDGIKLVTSKDRNAGYHPSGIVTNFPGNMTVQNFVAEDHYSTIDNLAASFFYIIPPSCIPDDDLIQICNYSNFSLSVNNDRGNKVNPIAIDISQVHYRSFVKILTDISMFGYQRTYFTPALFGGSPLDTIQINSISMKDCFLFSDAIKVSRFQKVIFGSMDHPQTVFENIGAFTDNFLSIFQNGHVEVNNFRVQNITGPFSRSLFFMYLNSLPNAPTKIQNIDITDYNFLNGGFVTTVDELEAIEVRNITIQNSFTQPGIPIFEINMIKSIQFSEVKVNGVQAIDQNDEDSAIFRVNELDLQSNANSSFANIQVSNCGISVLQFGSLVNSNSEFSQLELNNVVIRDSIYASSRSIISTENLENDANFLFKVYGFHAINVTFVRTGSLLLFSHALMNPAIVQDSLFENLTSTSILIESPGLSGNTFNEVLFQNCTFEVIHSLSQSLVIVSGQSSAKFLRNKFDFVTVSFDRSGMIEASSNSLIKFIDTNFTNNAAVTSTLFTVSSGAYVECNSCLITNNFAITNAVVSVSSNGHFKFFDSNVSGNIAIMAPIGQIFDASQISIIDRCKIHNNLAISPQDFEQEIANGCSKLCFVSTDLIDHINVNKRHHITYGYYLLEIVSGSLEIINHTEIYNQKELLNLLMTTCIVRSSVIRDINISQAPIRITASTLELHDLILTNINDSSQKEIFLINDESKFLISNLTYEHSNTNLLRALAGEMNINNLIIKNVSGFTNLMHIYSLVKVFIHSLTLGNLESNSEQIISIENAKNVMIDALEAGNINATVLSMIGSNVEYLNNINISSCTKALKIVDSNVTLSSNSSFTRNGKQNDLSSGGAISITNSDVKVTHTKFENNTAQEAGAIDFKCDSVTLCSLVLNNTTFTSNEASVQGGAIHYNFKHPEITNCAFENNSAQYGDDLASYPVKVRIQGQPDSLINFSNIGSGVKIEYPIIFALFDYDNQVMNLNSKDNLRIFSPSHSNSTIKGVNSVNFNAGIAIVEGIIFADQPGTKNVAFCTSTDAIDRKKISEAFPNTDFNSNITVDFRFCEPGEEITAQGTCQECVAGTYSLEWNSTKCTKCMEDAVCFGRNQISVNPGYWRASQKSSSIVECLVKESCKGGYTNSELNPINCEEGYQGELCSHCVVNDKAKYRKVDNFKCSKCPSPVINAILVGGLCIIVFAFMMTLIVININKTKESELSVLLRIMTNYFQLIFTSLSLSTSYPTSLISFFEIAKQFGNSSDTFLSFDCFIQDTEIEGIFGSNAIFKLFLLMLLPLILFAIVSTIWIIMHLLKSKYVKSLQRNLTISFISILFLLHPKLTEQSLGLFRCIDFSHDDSRVRIDTNIRCYSREHFQWIFMISIPIIIVWVIALPLVALVLLHFNIKKATENKVKQYFLILYQGLKRDKFYWEFVNTARKILVLLVFPLPVSMKMLVSVTILFLLTRLQIALQPYTDVDNNKIEILATNAGITTILSGLLYSQPDDINHLNLFGLVLCITINIHFLISWVHLFSKSFQDSSKPCQILYNFLNFVLCKKPKSPVPVTNPSKPRSPRKEQRYRIHKRRIQFGKQARGSNKRVGVRKDRKKTHRKKVKKNKDMLFDKVKSSRFGEVDDYNTSFRLQNPKNPLEYPKQLHRYSA